MTYSFNNLHQTEIDIVFYNILSMMTIRKKLMPQSQQDKIQTYIQPSALVASAPDKDIRSELNAKNYLN